MSGFCIDVADLLSHAGSRRRIARSEPVDDLDQASPVTLGPVALDVSLERIPDGIVVRGPIRVTWEGQCSACLRPVTQTLEVHVSELFEREPLEGETYPIEGHEIDLEQLVRDTVGLELPLAPHCSEPCEPVAVVTVDDDPDPRWRALTQLEL
jgi:uncharacterized protein